MVTDGILEKTGVLKREPFNANSAYLIILIIAYRTIYGAAGAYLAARLAPANPMKHAILLGLIGLVAGVIGTIIMWDVPPHWYPIVLILLTLPGAWLGGRLACAVKVSRRSN